MTTLSEFILNFAINASWQIIVIASVASLCARALKNAPARYRHTVWVAALLLSISLPLWTVLRITPEPVSVNTALKTAPQTPVQPAEREVVDSSSPALETESVDLNFLWERRPHVVATHSSLPLVFAGLYVAFLLWRIALLLRAGVRTRALIRSVYPAELSPDFHNVNRQCFQALHVAGVSLVSSELAKTPVTVGTLKPLIILPKKFYSETSGDILRSVLGHELAHIRRRDYALNLAYEILLLPISFHPATRFIKRQIDRTRELACDEMVVETLLKPESHARSLVHIASALVEPSRSAFILGIFDANILEERIMKLTQQTRRAGFGAARFITVASVVLLFVSTLAVSTFSFEMRPIAEAAIDRAFSEPEPEKNYSTTRAGETVQRPRDSATTRPQSMVATDPTNATNPTNPTDPQALAQAACDAGRQQNFDAIPQLLSMLGDDRRTTLLKCWESGRWSPALATFKHPSPGEQSAIALASMGRTAFGPLTEALAAPNAVVRRNAAWAIGELTNMAPGERSDAVPALISLLQDGDSWVRRATARALGELRDDRAGQPLVATLADSDEGVRLISAWALGEMKDQQAVDSLSTVLVSDARSEVRVAAAEALGEIRNRRAIAALKQALNDSEPGVRARARWALNEIEDVDG